MSLYSWRADRKATRAHIAESIQCALAEKIVIGGKSDAWYAACDVSRRWRDECRAMSVRALARRHLDYWRMRAFLGIESGGGGSYARLAMGSGSPSQMDAPIGARTSPRGQRELN